MKHKIEFGFGAGEDASGRPLLPSEVAIGMQRIRQRAAELFGGYTIVQTQGGWINPEGRLVEEPGFSLSVLLPVLDPRDCWKQEMDDMVDTIKQALRQQSVVTIVTQVEWEIV